MAAFARNREVMFGMATDCIHSGRSEVFPFLIPHSLVSHCTLALSSPTPQALRGGRRARPWARADRRRRCATSARPGPDPPLCHAAEAALRPRLFGYLGWCGASALSLRARCSGRAAPARVGTDKAAGNSRRRVLLVFSYPPRRSPPVEQISSFQTYGLSTLQTGRLRAISFFRVAFCVI